MKIKYFRALVLILVCTFLVGCSFGKEYENHDDVNSFKLNKSTIEEKKVVDKNGVKITVKGIDYDGYLGPVINLFVENNTDKEILVQDKHMLINGIMLDGGLSETVEANTSKDLGISFFGNSFGERNITTIKDIKFDLVVRDSESNDELFVEKDIVIETSATDYVQSYEVDGDLIINEGKLKVYSLGMVDSSLSKDIKLYVDNGSKYNITIQAEETKVNGKDIHATMSMDILSNAKAFDYLSFYNDALKAEKIDKIKELKVRFIVFDTETYEDIYQSEWVDISVD